MLMKNFTGKVSIVTGAAAGMGKAITSILVNNGYSVFLFDKNKKELLRVVQDEFAGKNVDYFCGDVTKKNDVEAALDQCIKKFGRIDSLIANVGLVEKIEFLEMTEEQWDKTLDVNLKGTFLWGQAVAKWMVQNGCDGSIVNIACMRASLVGKSMAAYATAKAGVRMLTKAMAVELAPYKINVNAIEPGRTLTDGLKKHVTDNDAATRRLKLIPLERFALAEEIAATVLFLISDQAKYITGAAIPVDGGYSITKD